MDLYPHIGESHALREILSALGPLHHRFKVPIDGDFICILGLVPIEKSAHRCGVRISIKGIQGAVLLEDWPDVTIGNQIIAGIAMESFSQGIAAAMVEVGFAPWIDAFELLLEGRVHIEGALHHLEAFTPAADAVGIGFEIRNQETDDAFARGTLVFSAPDAAALQAWMEKQSPYVSAHDERVSLEVYAEMGGAMLSEADFADLALGDVIILDTVQTAQQSLFRIFVAERPVWVASLKDGTLTIFKELTPTAPPTDLPERIISFRQSLGSWSYPRLTQIEEGFAFETTASLEAPAELYCGQTQIGTAQLVTLGDTLGMRVLSLAPILDRSEHEGL